MTLNLVRVYLGKTTRGKTLVSKESTPTAAASTDGYTEIFNLDKASRADLDNFVRENGLPDDASQLEQGKMYCVDDMIEAGADPIFNGTMAMAFISAQCVTWMRQVCFVAFCI